MPTTGIASALIPFALSNRRRLTSQQGEEGAVIPLSKLQMPASDNFRHPSICAS